MFFCLISKIKLKLFLVVAISLSLKNSLIIQIRKTQYELGTTFITKAPRRHKQTIAN
jgi:hypothetical protein